MTQDSQALTGSQGAGASQETQAPQALQACPPETKVTGEVCLVRWGPKVTLETQAALHMNPACPALQDGQDCKDPPGRLDHQDLTASCLALKEHKGAGATQGLPVSQGREDRKDGKVTLGTASVLKAISSSGVFQGCQDSRASQEPMGRQAGKGSPETPASTASLGSQGSREPLASSEPLGPRAPKAIPGQSAPKVRKGSLVSPACTG